MESKCNRTEVHGSFGWVANDGNEERGSEDISEAEIRI